MASDGMCMQVDYTIKTIQHASKVKRGYALERTNSNIHKTKQTLIRLLHAGTTTTHVKVCPLLYNAIIVARKVNTILYMLGCECH